MTFNEVIEKLRDGKGYAFTCRGLHGYFYKAPYPEQMKHTKRDGACSAITFWRSGRSATPTLMLYDFENDAEWEIVKHEDPVVPPNFSLPRLEREFGPEFKSQE